MMQDPDRKSAYLQTASIKPSLLLEGETPRLLDEWQIAPILWDAVRLAADNLKKFVSRVNTEKMREPSFLMILSATEFAYQRDDGVCVVPLGCLKP